MAKMGRLERQRAIQGWLFVSPFVVGFLLFFAGPMLFAAFISLNQWPVLGDPTFVGTLNFQNMLSDNLFWKSLKITTIYTLFSVPLGMIAGLALAMLLNQKIRGMALFRTLYYVPAVITGVALALLWWMMFNTEYGLINGALRLFGVDAIPWLTTTNWVLPALIIMSLWQVGGGVVIYLAGLQGIPSELYEAASIDGATGWSRFWHITIPMLSPVLLFNLVLGVIGSFQSFTNALIMTNGGPSQASLFFVLYIYRSAWLYNQMGYAAALSWALFAVILIMVIVIFRVTSARVFYAGGSTRGGF
ncbi:MAG: sugar ABC transporter permease [Chloroflexi bacterium]|nr:sugar ABC transporter permease [Chloroflexota bacterium]